MKIFIFRIWESLRLWTLKWSHSRHMAAALFFIAFIEASFFPIPPDILLVAILLINSERWWFYVGLTSIGSVLGAVLGYVIGFGFYEIIGYRIVEIYNLQEAVNFVGEKFSEHVFLTVFTAAFTPIPFKLITISAGLFKVSLWQMVLAAIIGRAMRYFAVAYIVKLFGEKVKNLVIKYFNIISLSFVIFIIFVFIAINVLF